MYVLFLYNNENVIHLKLGSKVINGSGTGSADRLNCIYFKRIVLKSYIILPVKYLSFTVIAGNACVDLDRVTDNITSNLQDDVERSFDGNHFTQVALQAMGLAASAVLKVFTLLIRETHCKATPWPGTA